MHGIQILSNDHTVHILKYLCEEFQRRHFKAYIPGVNVTFSTILQLILIESHIIGVQIPHPLALYRKASSKVCHKIDLV